MRHSGVLCRGIASRHVAPHHRTSATRVKQWWRNGKKNEYVTTSLFEGPFPITSPETFLSELSGELTARQRTRTIRMRMVTSQSVVAVSVVAETAAKPAAMMRLQKAQKRPTTPMPKPKRLKRVLKVPAKT